MLLIFDYDIFLDNNCCLDMKKMNIVDNIIYKYGNRSRRHLYIIILSSYPVQIKNKFCLYREYKKLNDRIDIIKNFCNDKKMSLGSVGFFDFNTTTIQNALDICCFDINKENGLKETNVHSIINIIHRQTLWIGSKNVDKINAIQATVDELKLDMIVRSCSVSSNVSSQPIGDKETTIGAYNRATAALSLMSGNDRLSDLAIGIENGITEGYDVLTKNKKYFDTPISVVVDFCSTDDVIVGKGPSVPIPFKNNLKEYQDHIKQFDNKVTEYYTNNVITRQKSCKVACDVAMGIWLKR